MSAVAAVLLFGGRDLRIARSYRVPFVVGILSSFVSLVTFRFISTLVGDSSALRNVDYFSFVVVGMFLVGTLDAALTAPASSVRSEQVQGTLEVLATKPMTPGALAAGWTAYPVLESLVTGVGMMLIAGLMGLRLNAPAIDAALMSVALSALVFSALGSIVAAFVLAFQQGGFLTRWLTAGLAMISGAYFPLTLMPGWIQAISWLSPMRHAMDAMRGSLLDGKGFAELTGPLLALAVSAIVLVPASRGLLGMAMRRARARGTISTY